MRSSTAATVKLSGQLSAYRIVRDGWGFGSLVANGETVRLTGTLLGVSVGDPIEVEGTWADHPQFGRQFKVKSCVPVQPAANDRDGTVVWLVASLPFVGPKVARALVERFGDDLWDVVEHRTQELTAVNSITPDRADAIRARYLEQRATRDAKMFLIGKAGLTEAQIKRCQEAWGDNLDKVVELIRQNPYELSREVYGFGFKRADKVALSIGIKPNAPVRIEAGVEYVLSQASIDGHCYMSGAQLQKMAMQELGADTKEVADAIRAAATRGTVVRHGWRIYPRRLHKAEVAAEERIDDLLSRAAAAVGAER